MFTLENDLTDFHEANLKSARVHNCQITNSSNPVSEKYDKYFLKQRKFVIQDRYMATLGTGSRGIKLAHRAVPIETVLINLKSDRSKTELLL